MTALNPVMTIGAQFSEHLKRLGIASRRTRSLELLDAVHLRDGAALLRRYPHQLSGGMCQRVLIAMAFAGRPRVIVADEPTTALDVTIQARIVQLIAELQRNAGTAMLFITHDLRLASRICDEIVVLYAGRAVERGPATSLLAEPAHPYTRSLQLASPTMTGPRRTLFALAHRMPGLLELAGMRGCRFAPRCPIAEADCLTIDPPDCPAGPLRVAACLRADVTHRIAASGLPVAPTISDGGAVLRLHDASKRFRSFRGATGTWAVRYASFVIGAGEFVGLVGESGSGKSTVARLIMGLERATSGRIVLGDRDVTRASAADARHRLHGRWSSGSAIRAQSAAQGRRHRHAGIAGGSPAAGPHPARGACARTAGRGGPRRRPAGTLPRAALRRPAAAREYRACAMCRAAPAGGGRDRVGPRCIGASAAAGIAASPARRTRHRAVVHLARPVGG